MKHFYSFTYLFLAATIAQAADQIVLPEMISFQTGAINKDSGGSNFRLSLPHMHHSISLSNIERTSGKTFGQLFKAHALELGLPWVLYTVIEKNAAHGTFNIEYHDVCNILQSPPHFDVGYYDMGKFLRSEPCNGAITGMADCVTMMGMFHRNDQKQKGCNDITKLEQSHFVTVVYYNPTELSETCPIESNLILSMQYYDRNKHVHRGGYDLSCALAIKAKSDYQELIPLLATLQASKEAICQRKYAFWLNTYSKLSKETQQQLINDAQERFDIQFTVDEK